VPAQCGGTGGFSSVGGKVAFSLLCGEKTISTLGKGEKDSSIKSRLAPFSRGEEEEKKGWKMEKRKARVLFWVNWVWGGGGKGD